MLYLCVKINNSQQAIELAKRLVNEGNAVTIEDEDYNKVWPQLQTKMTLEQFLEKIDSLTLDCYFEVKGVKLVGEQE